jgi:ubiquinone/menaquinone biosynthesis C-methylase UbiE
MDQQEHMQVFYEIFDASLPRLGPGDDASTRRALNTLLSARPKGRDVASASRLRVLDIGCGTGAPTIQLAKHIDTTILAVDNHQSFLDELQRRAKAAGVSERIQPCLKDMRALGMEDASFDLIWSEGALNIMGFREGLKACHALLAPGGSMAVTELCWLRPDPPAECQLFFDRVYPAIADIDANLAAIKACGYEVIEHFTLPESAWLEPCYLPLEERLRPLREKYASDPEKLGVVESIQTEIDVYRKYSSFYGYVFYLMQRR